MDRRIADHAPYPRRHPVAADDGVSRPSAITVAPVLVTRAAADLLDAIEHGEPPLRAIADVLSDLATASGATRAIASVDHAVLGRQVFCSHRATLDDAAEALFGEPCLRTEPPAEIEVNAERALLAATRLALTTLADAKSGIRRAQFVAHLRGIVDTAVANASRNHWSFTLALVHCDGPHGLVPPLEQELARAGDTVVVLDHDELAVILPATIGDDVSSALGHLSKRAQLPTFSYGIANCPSDATTTNALLQHAAERLAATIELRFDETVATLG